MTNYSNYIKSYNIVQETEIVSQEGNINDYYTEIEGRFACCSFVSNFMIQTTPIIQHTNGNQSEYSLIQQYIQQFDKEESLCLVFPICLSKDIHREFYMQIQFVDETSDRQLSLIQNIQVSDNSQISIKLKQSRITSKSFNFLSNSKSRKIWTDIYSQLPMAINNPPLKKYLYLDLYDQFTLQNIGFGQMNMFDFISIIKQSQYQQTDFVQQISVTVDQEEAQLYILGGSFSQIHEYTRKHNIQVDLNKIESNNKLDFDDNVTDSDLCDLFDDFDDDDFEDNQQDPPADVPNNISEKISEEVVKETVKEILLDTKPEPKQKPKAQLQNTLNSETLKVSKEPIIKESTIEPIKQPIEQIRQRYTDESKQPAEPKLIPNPFKTNKQQQQNNVPPKPAKKPVNIKNELKNLELKYKEKVQNESKEKIVKPNSKQKEEPTEGKQFRVVSAAYLKMIGK
ncbi:Hypothetical_protein [Hexamita inflata]|uniref:Hypothetical_protein n=1 Tax=Hexamita inflata TaxID=28002 RepID=A0AA86NXG0_9EUKA|nr:Hypothetical protein HINF_LOCUS14510 [Hexamita inflata]